MFRSRGVFQPWIWKIVLFNSHIVQIDFVAERSKALHLGCSLSWRRFKSCRSQTFIQNILYSYNPDDTPAGLNFPTSAHSGTGPVFMSTRAIPQVRTSEWCWFLEVTHLVLVLEDSQIILNLNCGCTILVVAVIIGGNAFWEPPIPWGVGYISSTW